MGRKKENLRMIGRNCLRAHVAHQRVSAIVALFLVRDKAMCVAGNWEVLNTDVNAIRVFKLVHLTIKHKIAFTRRRRWKSEKSAICRE